LAEAGVTEEVAIAMGYDSLDEYITVLTNGFNSATLALENVFNKFNLYSTDDGALETSLGNLSTLL
jgi:hypothetical protein